MSFRGFQKRKEDRLFARNKRISLKKCVKSQCTERTYSKDQKESQRGRGKTRRLSLGKGKKTVHKEEILGVTQLVGGKHVKLKASSLKRVPLVSGRK